MAKELTSAYSQTKEAVLRTLNSSIDGLTEKEATSRLKEYGPNTLTAKKKITALSIYFEQFKNNLILILIGSTFLILFIYFFGQKDKQDLIEAVLILAIIFLITTLGFFQEYKAEKSIEALRKLLAFRAKVKRDGAEIEIDIKNLVPGDIVILEEGQKVPADIRLLEVYNLLTNEAPLTGESNTVTKTSETLGPKKQVGDQQNMVFSGTIIASGRGIGTVIATGNQTEIGKIAQSVSEVKEDKTPIQKKLDQIGRNIGSLILIICAFVFVFIVFAAKDFTKLPTLDRIIHSFIAAVALAVAAIPEGLPAVVTISLALGTRKMLKKNALVRKLNSVETLGSTDVICCDKTGTLTRGEMTVKEVYFDDRLYQVSGTGYEKTGQFTHNGKIVDPKELSLLLKAGLECNNAQISESAVSGDPTEAALLISAYKAKLTSKSPRITEIPFSSERKMMSTVVKNGQMYLVYSKGAPEIVLGKCQKIIKSGKEQTLTNSDRARILKQTRQMSQRALRMLGFACKEISKDQLAKFKNQKGKIESGLIFTGLQGMIDPPRAEIKPLIQNCRQSGIRIIMITGDHLETAKAVAQEIGIEGEALSGQDLDKMNNYHLQRAIETVNIYARVNPSFKMRIVDALKKGDHIVAMTGDGVNDAPALKKADIGIAMGITGTDVAKEASDVVLLNDHFSTIIYAIEEGRAIFYNIRKFVTYLLSCNIAEVLIVLLGVTLFGKLPLTATMLLWINVVTDGIPAVALGQDPAERNILTKSPKVFQTQIITKTLWLEMTIYGILISSAVLILYLLNLSQGLQHAQGAAFMATVIFEIVNLYLIRSTYKTPFLSNPALLWSIAATITVQITLISIPPLARLFEVQKIDLFDWIYIVTASIVLWAVFKLIRKILDKTIVSTPKTMLL